MAKARTLRAWQNTALNSWISAGYRGIFEVATAGGKTVFALECMKVWLSRNPNSRVLILVPTTALQDQWFTSLVLDAGIEEQEICLWPDSQKPNLQFHIMVINTARTKSVLISESSSELLLIADECHRYASKENASALFINKNASLGLTATAEREYDEGLSEVLIPSLGEIKYKYSISDAREDSVVSPFEVRNVRVNFSESEDMRYKKLSRQISFAHSQGDDERARTLSMMRARVTRSAEARIPAAISIVEKHPGRRTVVFHEEIEKAELIATILKARGHSVALYHSQLGIDKRRENLIQFRKGMIDILVCCRALDEGVDVPEAEIAVIAAATNSSRQRIQRIGRVIRIHDSKEMAFVYTIYSTDRELEKLKLEEESLKEIAEFRWYEMSTRG